MGWNGSGAYSRNKTDIGKNRLRSNTPVIRTRNSNYLVWGVLALLLIFAGVAYFAFVSDESVVEQVEEKPKKKKKQIIEVKKPKAHRSADKEMVDEHDGELVNLNTPSQSPMAANNGEIENRRLLKGQTPSPLPNELEIKHGKKKNNK